MSAYIYCLYSTEDGEPRYVGRADDKVSYRFKQHITAALEKQPGSLYDWVRDVWRRGYDVSVYILQEGIVPADVDMFEQYWMQQFTGLKNTMNHKGIAEDTAIGRQVKAALQAQLMLAKNGDRSRS